MLGRKKDIPHFQSDFYFAKYHKLLRALLVTMGLIVLQILVIIYLVLFQPAPHYYGSTLTGELVPLVIKSGQTR